MTECERAEQMQKWEGVGQGTEWGQRKERGQAGRAGGGGKEGRGGGQGGQGVPELTSNTPGPAASADS